MTNDQLKITFLTVMPSPYVQDLFAAMSADARIDLTVWYLEQVAPDTYWGEQAMPGYARVLPGRWYGFSGARVHWNPGISKLIENSDADLFVIVGYIGLTNQVAMRTLNRLGRKWVFWGEVPGFQKRGWLGSRLRSFLQRPLQHANGIAAVGTRAVQAYQALVAQGNPGCCFASIPYHCRLDNFEKEGQRRVLSEATRFLYCGQLIERKGVDLLCRAFQRLVDAGHNVTLTLAGEGSLKNELQSSLTGAARERVHFLGFQPVSKLPEIFRDADVFALPSRHDGWGVVVNQALASGLPVISTTAVGAAADLVAGQGTGWVIPVQDEDRLFDVLVQASTDRVQLQAMGELAVQVAGRISLACAVDDWSLFFSSIESPTV